MSAFSDWKCGAMTDDEFDQWGIRYNAQEKYYDSLDDVEKEQEDDYSE